MPERICPMCGRSSNEVPFIGSLCRDCFVKKYGVARAPQSVEFTYCVSCHAHRDRGRWSAPYDDLPESLRDYLIAQLANRVRPVEPIQEVAIVDVELAEGEPPRSAYVRVEGRYNDVVVSDVIVVSVTPRPTLCPICASRKTGSGYSAVVQVRSYPRPLAEDKFSLDLVRRLVESLSDEVIKVKELREGLDVYVRDRSSARTLAARLRAEAGARIIETYKGGGLRSKLYVSVRIPTIAPGDLMSVDGRPMFYLAKTPRGFLLIDLESNGRMVMTPEELWSSEFGPYEGDNVRRAMLLSRQGDRYVFTWDAGSLEVPASQVVILTEDAAEGQEFLVYLSQSRVYILRREA